MALKICWNTCLFDIKTKSVLFRLPKIKCIVHVKRLVCYFRIKYVANQCFHHGSGPTAGIMYVCMYTLNFLLSQIYVFYQPWKAYNLKTKGFYFPKNIHPWNCVKFISQCYKKIFYLELVWGDPKVIRCSAKLFHLVVCGRRVNSPFFSPYMIVKICFKVLRMMSGKRTHPDAPHPLLFGNQGLHALPN